jgi:hypothetical protein
LEDRHHARRLNSKILRSDDENEMQEWEVDSTPRGNSQVCRGFSILKYEIVKHLSSKRCTYLLSCFQLSKNVNGIGLEDLDRVLLSVSKAPDGGLLHLVLLLPRL